MHKQYFQDVYNKIVFLFLTFEIVFSKIPFSILVAYQLQCVFLSFKGMGTSYKNFIASGDL